jgi:hypothetical protein
MKCKHETYYDYDKNNDLCEDCGLLMKKDRQYEKGDYIDFKIYGYPVNTNRSVQNLKQNLRKYKFPEHIVNQAIYWFRLDQNEKWSKKVMSQYLAKAAWQFGNSLTLNDIEQAMKIPITQIPKELTIPYKEEKSPSNRVQKKYPEEWFESTNHCCWWCTLTIDGKPVFLPAEIYSKSSFLTHGIFCGFSCIKAYLETDEKKMYYNRYLHYVAAEFGVDVDFVLPAPHFSYLEKFGGNLTDEEYKIFNKESCHPVQP